MSRWITRNDDGSITTTISELDECRWLYNEVCCNDECEECADYPYPSEKCLGSCPFFEKDDGKIID